MDSVNVSKMKMSFRTKMLASFVLSMLISGTITYLLYLVLRQYYRNYVYMEDPLAGIRHWMGQIGDLNVFLMLFIPLSIIIFYIITKPYVTYFQSISVGIRYLANGDFNKRVHLSSNDELQLIADDINRASEMLQAAITRGDFAEQSKNQLVMNLAHDLRTPLTSVIGYLDYILKHEELDKERTRHYTNIAYTKSKRLESLIEQLFEVTVMNYGYISLQRELLDMKELLAQLMEEMEPLFQTYGVKGRLMAESKLWIEGDGELLARVFENLLSNAARYGSDGQFVDVSVQVKEQHLEVKVSNYGVMIDEEEIHQVFELFYRGDQARTQSDSTGLGLYIAKNIVEQHGGTITVASDITSTSFIVTLPTS